MNIKYLVYLLTWNTVTLDYKLWSYLTVTHNCLTHAQGDGDVFTLATSSNFFCFKSELSTDFCHRLGVGLVHKSHGLFLSSSWDESAGPTQECET